MATKKDELNQPLSAEAGATLQSTASKSQLEDAARLDLTQLNGVGGEIYAINFLSRLQVCLEAASLVEVIQLSSQILGTLQTLCEMQRIGGASNVSYILAGRPYRSIMGRIYSSLFERLEGQGLFGVATSFFTRALDVKAAADSRVLALHILAALISAHGHLIASLVADMLADLSKVFRNGSHPYRLRHAAAACICASLSHIGSTLPETDAREYMKALRAHLVDKCGIIQKCAANILTRLFVLCIPLHKLSEIDNILAISLKAMDTADWQARQQHIVLCSSLLLISQIDTSQAQSGAISASGKSTRLESDPNAISESSSQPGSTYAPKSRLLSPTDMMLRLSSVYNKPAMSNKGRNAIIQTYSQLFTRLGPAYMGEHFQDVWAHLSGQIIEGSYSKMNGHNLKRSVTYISYIVGEVLIKHLFHEQLQLSTLHLLTAQLASVDVTPSSAVLQPASKAMVLELIAVCLTCFGRSSAIENLPLEEVILRSTKDSAAISRDAAIQCITIYMQGVPSRLPNALQVTVNNIEAIIPTLGRNQQVKEGRAPEEIRYLAALLARLLLLLPAFPLYTSADSCSQAVSVATRLLRCSADLTLATSTVVVPAAWTILSAVVSLKHSLAEVHLPQILLLWKNALPKPSHKEAALAETRSREEWLFLFKFREAVLRCISSYLHQSISHPQQSDLLPRIIAILGHAFAFYISSPRFDHLIDSDSDNSGAAGVKPYRNSYLQTLLAAYSVLAQQQVFDSNRQAICAICAQQIAQSDMKSPRNSGTAELLNSPNFKDAWPAPGVQSIGRPFDAASPIFDVDCSYAFADFVIEKLLRATEQDVLRGSETSLDTASEDASATISLYASLLPHLTLVDQRESVEYLLAISRQGAASHGNDLASSFGYSRYLLRISRIVELLRYNHSHGDSNGHLLTEDLLSKLRDILSPGLSQHDSNVREACSRAIATLCTSASTSFMAAQFQFAINTIVGNTDPYTRAGCVRLLAEVYRAVGTITAGTVLKSVIDITTTLASDPHPIVHYWALRALADIIDSAGLDFTPYSRTCLALVLHLAALDSHDATGGTLATSGRGNLPVQQALSAVLDRVISAAGPAILDGQGDFQLANSLVRSFLLETDVRTIVQAGRALQHLLLVSGQELVSAGLLGLLLSQLYSSIPAAQISAINSLYQIVRRDVFTVSRMGGEKLVERLFTVLDSDPSVNGIKQTIMTWLLQTAAVNPKAWVTICRRILSQESSLWQVDSKQSPRYAVEDEEAQGLDTGNEEASAASAARLLSLARWQTRLFALDCVKLLLAEVRNQRPAGPMVLEARGAGKSILPPLHSQIPELVRMALVASTAQNLELKLQGIDLLREIIMTFEHAIDTSFDNSPLLEQYQASIIAAIVPAFETDSPPEVQVAGLGLCGRFVAAGILRPTGDVSRAIKLLEKVLEGLKDGGGGTNADRYLPLPAISAVRLACGAAWARVYLSTTADGAGASLFRNKQLFLLNMWQDLLSIPLSHDPTTESVSEQGMPTVGPPDDGLESRLLVISAWSSMTLTSAGHTNTTSHLYPLLGDIIYCIDRHLLADTLSPDRAYINGLIMRSLSEILSLAEAIPRQVEDIELWDEVIQISYRLYLLERTFVDMYLCGIVANLFRLLGQQRSTSNVPTHYFDTCVRIHLLVYERGLQQGSEAGLNLAATAWQAALHIYNAQPDYVAVLLSFWTIFQRGLNEYPTVGLPAPMVHVLHHAVQESLALLPGETLARFRAICTSFVVGLGHILSRRGKNAVKSAVLYLQVLNIMGQASHKSDKAWDVGLLQDFAIIIVKSLAGGKDDILKSAGGILRAYAAGDDADNRFLVLLAITVVPESLHRILGSASHSGTEEEEHAEVSAVSAYAVMIGLLRVLGDREAGTRPLITNLYGWLLCKDLPPQFPRQLLVGAVLDLVRKDPQAFKNVYQNLDESKRQALTSITEIAGKQSMENNKASEIMPSIELKSFS